MEYRITLAIDRCSALTFSFLAASWWKIRSHQFVSSFPRFLPFFMSVIPLVSSDGGVWNPQCSFVSYLHIGKTWSFSLRPALNRKSPPQRRTTLNIFGKEVDLGGICSTNSVFIIRINKYTAEPSFGSSCNFIVKDSLTSSKIYITLFTRRRILSAEMGDVRSRLA